ncbi:hypothetical protein BH11PAT1_BH11PAT1_2450 [soil metagenome]
MNNELRAFIKNKGVFITPEIEIEIEQLTQLIKAQATSEIDDVLLWLEKKRKSYATSVQEVGINDLDKWQVDSLTGNISHESNKFFTMIGIKVSKAIGREVLSWTQPMIKQQECGILGILCQKRKGVMYYLMYAKSEPGSIVNPQLSPTLQATFSNLGMAHGGKKPRFSNYFENEGKGKVIISVEHIEDPSRFYMKTNRCMIVEIPENEKIKITKDFIWLTLPQIKKLLKMDRVVNALARAVFGSL